MAYDSLEKAGDRTWYIPGAVNVGVFEWNGQAVLIDSGNDKDAGRRIKRQLDALGLELSMIVTTHSNADHIGGNSYLQRNTGCRIAATSIEAAITENTILEPAFLYGGFPLPGTRNKFLEAKPSLVTDRIASSGAIGETALQAFPLPGHFLDMIGIRTPDDVVFLADSLFSEETITKYHLFFIFDVAGYLETLTMLESMTAKLFVPSHTEPTDNIAHLIEVNRNKINEICGEIVGACHDGPGFDELLFRICSRYSIDLNATQYVLVSSSLRSYLAYLAGDKGGRRVVPRFDDRRLLWVTGG